MAVTKTYTVHSVVEDQVKGTSQVNGLTVETLSPRVVVELVNGDHGHTFHFHPATDEELGEIRARFVQGAKINVTFEPGA
jgi:hypothetical protein